MEFKRSVCKSLVCSRTKKCRLGQADVGHKRTDACEVCTVWDTTASKTVVLKYNQVFNLVESKQPEFFTGMETDTAGKKIVEADSMEYFEGARE